MKVHGMVLKDRAVAVRWFLWRDDEEWSLHKNLECVASDGVNTQPLHSDVLLPPIGALRFVTEISQAEADYVMNPPEGEGWELRKVYSGDKVLSRFREFIECPTEAGEVDFINGLRWCRNPLEEQVEPDAQMAALSLVQGELIEIQDSFSAMKNALENAMDEVEKQIKKMEEGR